MACVRTTVSTRQYPVTFDVATALDEFKVTRVFTPHLTPVVAAYKGEMVPHSSLLASLDLWLLVLEHDFDHAAPYTALTSQKLGIPEDVKSTFCSRQCHACAILRAEKADGVLLVRAN